MSDKNLEFHFDFGSPTTYLAAPTGVTSWIYENMR